MKTQPHLAVLLATSGHSGVDRVMNNLLPAIAARGIKVDLLHIKNHGPYIDDPKINVIPLGSAHVNTSLTAVIRYLREQQPDVLFCDKDKVNRLALWARRLAGVKTRVVIRTGTTISIDMAHRKFSQRLIQTLSMRLFYRWADAIVVPSEGAADDLAQVCRLPRERVKAVPSPVITPQFNSALESPVTHTWLQNRKTPVILAVGELSPRKDFATLVRAFARVKKQQPVKLILLGKGKQQSSLRQLAQTLNINEDEFDMPGFEKNPYAYMAHADIFVSTSRWEGAPVVVMEALGAGLAIISSDCPSGPREILANGRYGKLFEIGDDEALAKAILDTLAQPPDQSTILAGAARYTLDNSVRCYLEAMSLPYYSSRSQQP